ncbi:MAG: hypothetical protein ISS84_00865 [Candidatus Pacebacteria bacterium]|nr:hypothetical protein [Candidatus Paceibacterota bacterium]
MNGEKKRLIIIDSNSLIHRAYHALPPLTTKKGELVNAVYGFLLVFLKALKEFQPDYIAACFDLPGPTFRHKKFKEYKAKRPPTPEELCQQIPKVKEILKSFDVPIFEKEGFEADDIIGTISKLAPRKQLIPEGEEDESSSTPFAIAREIETVILSGDLDVLQLVDKNTKVCTFKKGLKDTIIYDEKAVKERYTLSPSQLIDFRALKGDPSDNIPGVIGIGEKTAIQLIKLFGSLENLYREIETETEKAKEIKPLIKERLIKYKDQAFFSRMLSEIRKDAPIDFNLKKCRWKEYSKEKAVQILRNFEFYSLLGKLPNA